MTLAIDTPILSFGSPEALRSHLHTRSITELRALAIRTGIYKTTMRRRVVLIEAIVNAKTEKPAPAIPAEGKHIVYDNETRDYMLYLDGQFVGVARTEHEGDTTLDTLADEIARHTRATTADMAAEKAAERAEELTQPPCDFYKSPRWWRPTDQPCRNAAIYTDGTANFCLICHKSYLDEHDSDPFTLIPGARDNLGPISAPFNEAAFRAELAERTGPEWSCTPENPCDGECAEHSINEELSAQGLRLADEDEPGYYVLVTGGKHVWATDEPPRWGNPVAAPIFEEETAPYLAAPTHDDLAAALDSAVTARLPIPRNTPEWDAAQAAVDRAHEALDPVGYRAARAAKKSPEPWHRAAWREDWHQRHPATPDAPPYTLLADPVDDERERDEYDQFQERDRDADDLTTLDRLALVPQSDDPCADVRRERDRLKAACEGAFEALNQRWGHADAPYDPDMLHVIQVLRAALTDTDAKNTERNIRRLYGDALAAPKDGNEPSNSGLPF